MLMIAMGTFPLPSKPIPVPDEPRIKTSREKVLAVAKSTLGWREKTGQNDGPEIERILSVVGLKGTGSPWCAAFCVFCYEEAGVGHKIPNSAWSPTLVANPTWKRGDGETPRVADIYGIFFPSKGRVAHVGIVQSWSGGTCVGIEGNTGPDGVEGTETDRAGDGVYKRWRPTMSIYSAKSFL